MLLQFLLTYKNPILHTTLALSLTFLFSFFKIPSFFLYGLHTYIQPDNLNQNGVRAAIKRPESSGTPEGYQYLSSNSKPNNATEPRKRIKSKDKDKFEFDENNAQIFRLKLDTNHVQSRLYFDEYHTAFTVSFVSLSC